jgi:tetratricopeptide (TPR) repeat protein
MKISNEVSRKKALLLWHEGMLHHHLGDLLKAIDLYTQSIAIHPTAESYAFRGWAYSFFGNFQEAIEECKKAIRVDPTLGNPYNDIGSYLITQGKLEEAERWLARAKTAVRYEDAAHYPYVNLGRIYAAQGRLIQAAQEFEHGLKIFPGEPHCIAALEEIYKFLH